MADTKQTNTSDKGNYAVNSVIVYDDSGKNAIEGLRILDVKCYEDSSITSSPIESGVMIHDCKIRLPKRVVITGICDNVRGEIEIKESSDGYKIGTSGEIIPEEGFDWIDAGFKVGNIIAGATGVPGLGLVADIYNASKESSISTEEKVDHFAKRVYDNIQKMLEDNGSNGKIKTYTISTKGKIYQDMTLKTVEQLNDAEHLLVIPVTLTFEQLLFVKKAEIGDNTANVDDKNISLKGSKKRGGFWQRFGEGLLTAFADYTGIDIIGALS